MAYSLRAAKALRRIFRGANRRFRRRMRIKVMRRRRRYRKSYKGSLARRAYRIARYVARTRPKPELKWQDTRIAGTPIIIGPGFDQGYMINPFTGIGQGVGLGQFLGQAWKEHSLKINFLLRGGVLTQGGADQIAPVFGRIMIVRFPDDRVHQNPPVAPTLASILYNPVECYHSWYCTKRDVSYLNAYKVIYDQRIKLMPIVTGEDDPTENWTVGTVPTGMTNSYYGKIRLKLSSLVSIANVGTANNDMSNGLWIFFLNDNNSTDDIYISYLEWRYMFTDS